MSVGRIVADTLLRALFANGGYLSLHTGNPGASGMGMIGQQMRYNAGVFTVVDSRCANNQDLSLGKASAGGLATYFGLWTQDRQWITGGRLRSAIQINAGYVINVRRDDIGVRVQ